MSPIRVTIWNEYVHERSNTEVQKIYPKGIHGALADALTKHAELEIRTATLDQPEHGLTKEALERTDVLTWWGHAAHDEVNDAVAARVQQRVIEGMGLVVLHSGHLSKPFVRLMGTSCHLCWREAGERERIWVVNPGHPITAGIDRYIELENSEAYGEPFGIPTPDEQVFISWFQGGEVFRGGNCWTRGSGRIFYFSPGHEAYPIYHNPLIQQVIYNAIFWAKPQGIKAAVPRHVPLSEAREKLVARGVRLHDSAGVLGHGEGAVGK
jgi:trehalose utilization protein